MVRIEVTHFWRETLLKAPCPVIALVGNHDLGGNATGDPTVHALEAYKDIPNVTIVDEPVQIEGVGYLPYMADPEAFVKAANSLPVANILCHATFVGAKYGNDFPAPDGVDPDRLTCLGVISGHIHMIQQIGKVQYIGSPRWLTASDANQDRGIWLFDDIKMLESSLDSARSPFSTEEVCRKIISATITPDQDIVMDWPKNARVIVTLKGPKQWVTEKLELMPDLKEDGIETRSVYVEDKEPEVRESEGLAVSLQKYVLAKEWPAPKDEVWAEIQRRVQWTPRT
jgi:hypothetical protein